MAQITSISNGEAMSSVRTKLNDVITNVNLLDPTDWVDYSGTSTIVGWSSRTVTQLKYRIVGKQVFVLFAFTGTSNSTTTSFTLPSSNNFGAECSAMIRAVDNGVVTSTPGSALLASASSTVLLYKSTNSTVFTATGSKTVIGQFNYEIA